MRQGALLAALIAAFGLFTPVQAVLGPTPLPAVVLPFLFNPVVLILALIAPEKIWRLIEHT